MYKHSADGGCSAAPAIIVTISDAPRTRTRVVGQRSPMFAVFLTDYKLCVMVWIFSNLFFLELNEGFNSGATVYWPSTRVELKTTDYMDRISTSNGIYFERLRDFLMCRICSFAIKRLARCYNWYELSRKKEPVILRQCGIVLVISGIVDTNLGGVVDRNYLIRESV